MNNSFLRSPSRLFMTSIILAVSIGIITALSSSKKQSKNKPEISIGSVFSSPIARRSQNVEIAPTTAQSIPEISPPQILPSVPTEEKQFNPVNPDSSQTKPEPEIEKLIINLCNGQSGNANFWAGDSKIGIISQGTEVQLTGKVSGDWVEAIAVYWPNDRAIQESGQFWINKCWLPAGFEFSIAPDTTDTDTEPLALLGGRRSRVHSGLGSRPRKRYMQSTGELAGYVGRDLVDYALLYPRIAAYQRFWDFATASGGGGVSVSSAVASGSDFQPQQVTPQMIEIAPGMYQGVAQSQSQPSQPVQYQSQQPLTRYPDPPYVQIIEFGDTSPLYADLQKINPKMMQRLNIVSGEPLLPYQATLLRNKL